MPKAFSLLLLALIAGCTCNKKNADETITPEDTPASSITLQNQPAPPADSSEIVFRNVQPEVIKDSAIVTNKVLKLPNGGWGYYIYMDGEAVIYQDVIPGVNTSTGFVNEKEAKIIADVVSEKIRNNIIPPAISIQEMKSLGITLPKEK